MSVIAGDNSVAVNNALSDYSQCLDRGDEDEFVKLFAPEFTLEIAATNLKINDEEGLRGFVKSINKKVPNAQHWEGNVLLGRSNNWYTNYSYWKCIQNGNIVAYGTHEDLLLVKDGVAKFVSRKIKHVFPVKKTKKQRKPRRRGPLLNPDTTLYVAGFKRSATRSETADALEKEFERFGKVKSVQSGGAFAFVEFEEKAALEKALEAGAAKIIVDGNELVVERKNPRKTDDDAAADDN